MESRCWKLCPSDLGFLWGQCPRCFYLTKVHDFRQPKGSFPKIFNQIDARMKQCFMNTRVEASTPELPKGIIAYWDESVRSVPLSIPGHTSTVVLHGKLDTAALFDDGTAGVLDLKTSSPRDMYIQYYSRQLHSYAIAAEHAAAGCFSLRKVSRLGLLVFEPLRFKHQPNNTSGIAAYYGGGLSWVEIQRNDEPFFEELSRAVTVLESPTLPPPGPECTYCRYLDSAGRLGLVNPPFPTTGDDQPGMAA